MICNFLAVLNFNQLFLKLSRLICNKLSVLPDHCYHTPYNKISDTITHVTLNTINGVVDSNVLHMKETSSSLECIPMQLRVDFSNAKYLKENCTHLLTSFPLTSLLVFHFISSLSQTCHEQVNSKASFLSSLVFFISNINNCGRFWKQLVNWSRSLVSQSQQIL